MDDEENDYWFRVSIAPLLRGQKRHAVVTLSILPSVKIGSCSWNSPSYYYRMFENFDALIWKTDLEGNVVYFNRSWSLFTGKDNEAYLRIKWLDLIHPEDRKFYMELKRKRAAKNPLVFSIGFVMSRVITAGLKGYIAHPLRWMAAMAGTSALALILPIVKTWRKD